MGTRATIKIEGLTHAQLYQHLDGNPEHTLPWLEDFNQRFTAARGDDPEYKLAQLIRDTVVSAGKFNLDNNDTCTGWGVVEYDQGYDADYVYTLHTNGTVSFTQE